MSIRTLPLRVAPQPGEALDSWLEMLAHYHHARFGDLLHHVGIYVRTRRLFAKLPEHELYNVSAATGVAPDVISAMTLQRFATIRATDGQASNHQWSLSDRSQSRFCSQCLAQSGGRWQLAWRLRSSFACTTHCCLLADDCVSCGRRVRSDRHRWREIPRPGQCANRRRDERHQPCERCDANLAAQPVASLPENHTILAAQRIVSALMSAEAPTFGVYASHQTSADAALSDIRYLARLLLSIRSRDALRQELDPQLVKIYLADQRSMSRAHIGDAPPLGDDTARSAGTAIAAAIDVLQCTDIALAGTKMRWMIGKQRLDTTQATVRAVPHTTKVLNAIRIKAFSPHLSAFGQLRYRATTPMPRTPDMTSAAIDHLAQSLSGSLWAAWALPFHISGMRLSTLRQVLSCAVIAVGAGIQRSTARELLGTITAPAQMGILAAKLQRHPRWQDMASGIYTLHDYLTSTHCPVNYRRRRQLDYSDLLPETRWREICIETATGPGVGRKIDVARSWLFERLSGSAARTSPFIRAATNYGDFCEAIDNFPLLLTPALSQHLHAEAVSFLTTRNLEEPVTWHPPLELLKGLNLPGPDPSVVDLKDLQDRVVNDCGSPGNIAEQLGTTIDVIRYLLTDAPARHPPDRRSPDLRDRLTRSQFHYLYQQKQMTCTEIAQLHAVSRSAVCALGHEYGLPIQRGSRRIRPISRDWLHDQLTTKQLSYSEIGRDAGMSRQVIRRRAKEYGITPPPRHHRQVEDSDSIPAILRPAVGRKGRLRLQRFAAVHQYRTLTEAAAALGVHGTPLRRQIATLEHDLGSPLITRAVRNHPMSLTAFGARVLAAVQAWNRDESVEADDRPHFSVMSR